MRTPSVRSAGVAAPAAASLLVLLALLALLSGCGSDTTPVKFAHYVALGDSYTAAPGVEPALGTGDCGRSTANYPRLVAAALRAPLDDVSCSGATVTDLLKGQTVTGQVLPAQIAAVKADTDLITIGVGGNDLDLIGLATVCVQQAADCTTRVAQVQQTLGALPGRIEKLVRAVRAKAPKATVVLVGYPTIISAQAPCAALPVPAAVTSAAIDINSRLATAIKAAATATKVQFADLYRATADHGLCGSKPWIAGIDGQGAQPLHPTEDEQKLVAEKVLALVR
ncbi:SGNH/GDSL hydrolase family protein [Nocardioides sp.]|uniref:SGNH/GDSL hydrolase family protein n=1 Tax=Nocardioides sp. TaxID=35761 RepID=UPI002624BB49|nr:SGNH/GDSL hydrolase family protein [Nocardioides sp.]